VARKNRPFLGGNFVGSVSVTCPDELFEYEGKHTHAAVINVGACVHLASSKLVGPQCPDTRVDCLIGVIGKVGNLALTFQQIHEAGFQGWGGGCHAFAGAMWAVWLGIGIRHPAVRLRWIRFIPPPPAGGAEGREGSLPLSRS
jgi:hypothetical protein